MKLSDKLAKCGDSLTVNIYDNGFMVEVGGRNSEDDWKSAKIMCQTLEEVYAVIKEASNMTKE
jgi:TATA-box binding protein (TBP) (component of TFIID and TFIIIB)